MCYSNIVAPLRRVFRSLTREVRVLARDAELDRLKSAQDSAFQRKQDAWQAQDRTWNELQRVRNNNGSRIDRLNAEHDRTFDAMRAAFDSASRAFDGRDHLGARSYADQGNRYKADLPGIVDERRRLVEEIRTASQRHNQAKEAFRSAKAEFDRASQRFKQRLEQVKAGNQRKRNDKREIAQKAGVPYRYLDDVWVSQQPDGSVNVYFGGVGEPNGPGHGHYAMDRYGAVTYRREPFDPHGPQNFHRDERVEREMAQLAMAAWARQHTTKRQIQYTDGAYTVKAGSGYSRDRDAITTDVIIAERSNSAEHYHLVIDEFGNVVYSEWRKNR